MNPKKEKHPIEEYQREIRGVSRWLLWYYKFFPYRAYDKFQKFCFSIEKLMRKILRKPEENGSSQNKRVELYYMTYYYDKRKK